MTPHTLHTMVIDPVLAELPFPQPRERTVLLMAIAIHESNLKHRRQMADGPARSFWQMEAVAVNDTLQRCKPVRDFWHLLELEDDHVVARPYVWGPQVKRAVELSDLGACALAAGILFLRPGRLPEVGYPYRAWDYYLAAWKPGKPGLARWPGAYRDAMKEDSDSVS